MSRIEIITGKTNSPNVNTASSVVRVRVLVAICAALVGYGQHRAMAQTRVGITVEDSSVSQASGETCAQLNCPDDGLFCNGPEVCFVTVNGAGCGQGPKPCDDACCEVSDTCIPFDACCALPLTPLGGPLDACQGGTAALTFPPGTTVMDLSLFNAHSTVEGSYLVYRFTDINIPSGHRLDIFPGNPSRPVVLLSSGNVTMSGTIDMRRGQCPPNDPDPLAHDSCSVVSSAGGGYGGFFSVDFPDFYWNGKPPPDRFGDPELGGAYGLHFAVPPGTEGSGPCAEPTGGGGGGFGGRGGAAFITFDAATPVVVESRPGGEAYGDLRDCLEGGAGGGTGIPAFTATPCNGVTCHFGGVGGGGGGALEIGACGSLSISGTIFASGFNGDTGSGCLPPFSLSKDIFAQTRRTFASSGGGGAGGGVRLHGDRVDLSTARISAHGGSSFGRDPRQNAGGIVDFGGGAGGAGGGGRVFVEASRYVVGSGTNINVRRGRVGDLDTGEDFLNTADHGVAELDARILEIPVGHSFLMPTTEIGGLTVDFGLINAVEVRGSVDIVGIVTLNTLKVESTGTVIVGSASGTSGVLNATTIDHTHGGNFHFTGGALCVDLFQGNLDNTGGCTSPGGAGLVGKTTITGDYNQVGGQILIDIGVTGISDTLIVNGNVNLTGDLLLTFKPGYTPNTGDEFTILGTTGELKGEFQRFISSGTGDFGLTIAYDRESTIRRVIAVVTTLEIDPARTLYVDASKPIANFACTGNWANACPKLEDAITQAFLNPLYNTILVAGSAAPGGAKYVTANVASDPDPRESHFVLVPGVSIYGGFPPGGGEFADRDPDKYETVLTGDIAGNDTPSGGGNQENAYHVISLELFDHAPGFPAATFVNTIISGLTITGGNASGSGFGDLDTDRGGGLLLNMDTIQPNGILDPVRLTISRCCFIYNRADFGGAIFNNGGELLIVNSEFHANSGEERGGAFDNAEASPFLINTTFIGNSGVIGGGMRNESRFVAAVPQLNNCNFIQNFASESGGAFFNTARFPIIAAPSFTDCVFAQNHAPNSAGNQRSECATHVDWQESRAEVTVVRNCSFDNEVGGTCFGGLLRGGSNGNLQTPPNLVRTPDPGDDGSWNGINDDFGDLKLNPASNLISAGSNNRVGLPVPVPLDLGGNPRRVGLPDIGAHEFQPAIVPAPPSVPVPDTSITIPRGDTLTLPVGVTGTPSPTLQWFKRDAVGGFPALVDGGRVSGVNSATLVVTDVQYSDSTLYVMNANNSEGFLQVFRTVNVIYPCTGPILYVDADATGNGTGCNWQDAFTSPSDALAEVANAGGVVNQIWVAEGTYTPDSQNDSFIIPNGITMYGGFGGSESLLSERNATLNLTTLSGDILQNDVTGDASTKTDNCKHVIANISTSGSMGIDGFAVSGGFANGTFPDNSGGGLFTDSGIVTVSNCVFRDNHSDGDGGAVFMDGGDITMTSCKVISNRAGDTGGGVSFANGPGSLVGCLIARNEAGIGGGLILQSFDPFFVTNCTIANNTKFDSGSCGGGVLLISATGWVSNSIIYGNTGCAGTVEGNQIGLIVSTLNLNRSLVQELTGTLGGSGNIGGDPLFADSAFRLSSISPATDAGENVFLPVGITTDLDGLPRFVDNLCVTDTGGIAPVIDMGAFENNVTDSDCDRVPDSEDRCPGFDDLVDDDGNNIPDACDPCTGPMFYVDADATGNGTGCNWQDAFTSLSDALADVTNTGGLVDQIWVAEGTYTPDSQNDSFELANGIAMYGGFNGSESLLSERDVTQNITTLSGDILQNDVTGDATTKTDNCKHVVWDATSGGSATIDGFTVSGGFANGSSSPDNTGAGMYVGVGSSVIARNCRFRRNECVGVGGAVAVYADLTMTNCRVTDNVSQAFGAGVFYFGGSSGSVTNSVFSGNRGVRVGALSSQNGVTLDVTNCSIVDNFNAAPGEASGLTVFNATTNVTNTIVYGNVSGVGTGENAQISKAGGATLSLNHSLIQGLTGTLGGTGNIGGDPLFVDPTGPVYNLQLLPGSPGIDAANNVFLPADVTDIDGDGNVAEQLPMDLNRHTRIADDPATIDSGNPLGAPAIVDMGAYEYLAGDDNGDGVTDMLDFAGFGSCLTGPGGSVSIECIFFDMDGDGVVDSIDYALFQLAFTGSP